jgi:hypothetical protein
MYIEFTMGSTLSCSSDQTSCSSVFASCKNDHCASNCSKIQAELQPAAAIIEHAVEGAIAKFIADHMHAFLAEHVPPIVATHLETVAASALGIDSIQIESIPEEPTPT